MGSRNFQIVFHLFRENMEDFWSLNLKDFQWKLIEMGTIVNQLCASGRHSFYSSLELIFKPLIFNQTRFLTEMWVDKSENHTESGDQWFNNWNWYKMTRCIQQKTTVWERWLVGNFLIVYSNFMIDYFGNLYKGFQTSQNTPFWFSSNQWLAIFNTYLG